MSKDIPEKVSFVLTFMYTPHFMIIDLQLLYVQYNYFIEADEFFDCAENFAESIITHKFPCVRACVSVSFY